MDKQKNYLALKKFCLQHGADLFGVADIRQIKNEFALREEVLKNLNQAICLGMRLSRAILQEIESGPTRLYFHHYKTLNMALDQLALKVTSYIQKIGYTALPIPASQILDWQNQKAHLSHKRLGVLAGLGWIGRSNLLVNESLGAQFRLVSILTDLPLKPDQPLKRDCRDCLLCLSACPAQAIKDDVLSFQHQECFAKLKEFQKQRLTDQYICGICVKVCRGKSKAI